MVESLKAHSKEVEKYKYFLGGLILMVGLPGLKNSQK
jgi:hypothetical protein